MVARFLALWLAVVTAFSAPTEAWRSRPRFITVAAAQSLTLGESMPPLPGARRGLPIGHFFEFIFEAIGGFFRFIGSIIRGIFEFFGAIAKGIASVAANGVSSIKALFHGGKVAEHAKPQSADNAAQLSRTGDAGASAANDPSIVNHSASQTPPGNDNRLIQDVESLGRLTDEVKVRNEMEAVNRECGTKAAGIAAANHVIVKECLVQVRQVRERCSQQQGAAAQSRRRCKAEAEKSDDDCSVADSTQFFLELSAACHAYAVARR